MKKPILSLLILAATVQFTYSQKPTILTEAWAANPAISAINSKYSKESAVVLSDRRRIEYVDDGKGDVLAYYTLHKLIHINDDRSIERFNKIYLGLNEKADIVDVKARTILPKGKTFNLNQNDIKEIKEKDGNLYKIFAMEGLEKGCEVEYTYTFKRPVSFTGREALQGDLPQLETTFEIVCPERLHFEIKPFNFSFNPVDTVINGKRFVKCLQKETEGVDEEKYAFYDANVKRIEYKLAYNDAARKGERLFTWNELARRIYSVYTDFTPKENSSIIALTAENGWEKLKDEPAKIVAVENYIKSKYTYNEDQSDAETNTIAAVVKNKAGGTVGFMKLYTAIFQALGVNYQYVLAADRSRTAIDRTFENWNNCDYALFFFPSLNKFIAPTRIDFRYPWIVPTWGGSNGLFFRRTSLGNITTAVSEIRNIELEDYTQSINNIDTRLELNSSMDSLSIDAKQYYSGYAAVDLRSAYNFSNDDTRQKIIKQMAKMLSSSENVIFSEVIDPEFEKAVSNRPVTLHIKTKSGELIERAGNKLLIKVGMVIGQQVEMYQEKKRQFPINIDYGHIEDRKIEMLIPKGYIVKNLNDLKINQVYKDNGAQTMGFTSDYKLNDNVLSINISEDYRNTFYPLTQFDQFRKIINSSSDFNKVVLVLEKI